MTKEEFFEMNVGDEFLYEGFNYSVLSRKVIQDDIILMICFERDHIMIDIRYSNYKRWVSFISDSFKYPNLFQVERVDRKIAELKAELEKWEAEKKRLEIQPGKFYELTRKSIFGDYGTTTETFYVFKIEGNILYVSNVSKQKTIIKDIITSFKQITDISVLEQAWKNE